MPVRLDRRTGTGCEKRNPLDTSIEARKIGPDQQENLRIVISLSGGRTLTNNRRGNIAELTVDDLKSGFASRANI